MHFCVSCSKYVANKAWVGHLRSKAHKDKCVLSQHLDIDGVDILSSAFWSRIASYRITAVSSNEQRSVTDFLQLNNYKLKFLIDESLRKHTCVKVNFELYATFRTFKYDEHEIKSFCSRNFNIFYNYNFDTISNEITNIMNKKIEKFEGRDSGWTLVGISHFEININKYQPLQGSSFIELSKFIKTKKACVNIRNKDNYCFLWCVTAFVCPAYQHSDRISSYPHFTTLFDIKDMKFPVTFSDIKTFEKNNPNYSFIVYYRSLI